MSISRWIDKKPVVHIHNGVLLSHFSLSCTGEGNGNSLQCSCLENPRDGGAWWAAVYGVAQSRTQLKQLSSSSIFHICIYPAFQCLSIRIYKIQGLQLDINIQIYWAHFMCENEKPSCRRCISYRLCHSVFNLSPGFESVKWFCFLIYYSNKAYLWIRMIRTLVNLQVIWH